MYNNTKYTGNIQKNVDIRDISIIIVVPDQEIEYDHLRTDSRSCESRRCWVRPVIVKDNRADFFICLCPDIGQGDMLLCTHWRLERMNRHGTMAYVRR